MSFYKKPNFFIYLLIFFSANCFSTDTARVVFTPGIYSVKTKIIMPHLRDNLHYTNTETRQCLDQQDVSRVFPILSEASFNNCALVSRNNPTAMEYDLVCSNPTAATGIALFIIGESFFRATLDIKMGGKNMTFTQQVSGHRMGACE